MAFLIITNETRIRSCSKNSKESLGRRRKILKDFYIGKCPECRTIVAGAVAESRYVAKDVKEMIDNGLIVEKISAETVEIRSCPHCGKRKIK